MNEVRTKADQILKKGKSRMPAMDLSFLDFFSAHTALKTSRPHKFKTLKPNFFSKNPLQCQLFYVFLRHEITQSPKSRRYEKICISSRYRLVSADTRRRQGLC